MNTSGICLAPPETDEYTEPYDSPVTEEESRNIVSLASLGA